MIVTSYGSSLGEGPGDEANEVAILIYGTVATLVAAVDKDKPQY